MKLQNSSFAFQVVVKLMFVASMILAIILPLWGVLMSILAILAHKQLASFGFRTWAVVMAHLIGPIYWLIMFSLF